MNGGLGPMAANTKRPKNGKIIIGERERVHKNVVSVPNLYLP
jgi:hypothetical protein